MTRIVTTTYRYKPPPKKRKAVAIAGPAIVRKAAPPLALEPNASGPAVVRKAKAGITVEPTETSPANDGGKPEVPVGLSLASNETSPAIVTARRPGARRVDVPDLTPEEYQRRGDAADALWRELVRRATSKDRP